MNTRRNLRQRDRTREIAARNQAMRQICRMLGDSTWRPMDKQGRRRDPVPL